MSPSAEQTTSGPTTQNEASERSGFAALIGMANAGKSTLLNSLLGSKVSIVTPKPQTTRNRVLGVKSGEDYQVVFLDTPGFLKQNRNKALGEFLDSTLSQSVTDVDINVLVLDGERAVSERKHLDEVFSLLEDKKLPSPGVVAVNKIDLIDKKSLLPLIKAVEEKWKGRDSASLEIVPVSAKREDGLELLLQIISSKLPFGPCYFPKTMLTDQSEQFLTSEIIREKLFLQLHREIPYSVAVVIERWEDEQSLLKIGAVILVERLSQKPIIIGKNGAKLKTVGCAARLELERLFGTKVFLELFVRVESNWTKSSRGLRRAGVQQ